MLQIKKYCMHILRGLALLYESRIIHCDLKPENILLSPNLQILKLIDFGSSCYINQRVYSYIQSRFYRAPEITLGIPYTSAIDIWSFGCILVELYTGLPIFPAESEGELVSCIVEVLGIPSLEIRKQGSRSGKYFTPEGELIPYVNRKGKQRMPKARSLFSILKGAERGFIKLIEDCLQWDPRLRCTAESALKSEWLLDLSNSMQLTTRRCKISMEDITKHTPKLQKFIAERKVSHSTVNK